MARLVNKYGRMLWVCEGPEKDARQAAERYTDSVIVSTVTPSGGTAFECFRGVEATLKLCKGFAVTITNPRTNQVIYAPAESRRKHVR